MGSYRQGYGWLSNANWDLAQKWSDNFKEYTTVGSQQYQNQPIEADAFNFENAVINFLFWK
jgi:hypothetical protein